MNFGEKITVLRKQKGITQEQLAEKLGVTRQTISKWELNQSTPDLNYISMLSDLFEVTTDYLIKEEKTEDKEEQIIHDGYTNSDYTNMTKRESVKPSFVAGIILTVLGVAFMIIGIVLGLNEAGGDLSIIVVVAGVLNVIIGMVLMFVKKHPVLTALWIVWVILFLFMSVFVVNMIGGIGDVFSINTVGGIVNWLILISFVILVVFTVRARRK